MTADTIFALATPHARSGVAIIRISGANALAALSALTGKDDWQPNCAHLHNLRNQKTAETIDKALVLYFRAPKSFTGEDVAELHCHGSLAVIRELLAVLATMEGLRPAEPGEFTRRAFASGKMDLMEAEGLADLIDAETPAQKAQALRQMEGSLSSYYDELRTRIVTALAHLEAYIDFPEEEIPASVLEGLGGEVRGLITLIETALADEKRGERVRNGIGVIIVGAPNAGKSSLLNRLARRDAAIVSHHAGTTRDIIEIHMDLGGFPVILMDTAGLRDTADSIEEEGVRRALERAGQADIRLVLFDSATGKDPASMALIDDNSLIINTKIDLPHHTGRRGDDEYFISTATGEGIEQLLAALEAKIAAIFSQSHAPVITRERHRALLAQSLIRLQQIDFSAPLELTCEELRQAAQIIAKITGKIAVDDVLDVIFKQFCIGK